MMGVNIQIGLELEDIPHEVSRLLEDVSKKTARSLDDVDSIATSLKNDEIELENLAEQIASLQQFAHLSKKIVMRLEDCIAILNGFVILKKKELEPPQPELITPPETNKDSFSDS
jgi:hypothetical protein